MQIKYIIARADHVHIHRLVGTCELRDEHVQQEADRNREEKGGANEENRICHHANVVVDDVHAHEHLQERQGTNSMPGKVRVLLVEKSRNTGAGRQEVV